MNHDASFRGRASPASGLRRPSTSSRAPIPGEGLLHPASLFAILVMTLNDHWWKFAYPGFVTGKVSDFAGLAFFPLLLVGGWEIAQAALRRPWAPSRRALFVAVSATAVVFSAVKLWPSAGEVYRIGLPLLQWPFHALVRLAAGRPVLPPSRVSLAQDPTDLLALPALGLALYVGLRACEARQRDTRVRPPTQ